MNGERELLFYQHDLGETLENLAPKAMHTISSLTEDQVSIEREEELLRRLRDEFVVSPIRLKQQGISRQGPRDCVIELSGEAAFEYGVDQSAVPGEEITIIVPFEGDGWLFSMKPSEWSTCFPGGEVTDDELCLRFRAPKLSAEQVRRDYERELGEVDTYLRRQTRDIEAYNERIEDRMKAAVEARRSELARRSVEFTDALGMPEHRETNMEQTSSRAGSPAVVRNRVSGRRGVPKVFLCYSKEDSEQAATLYEQLEAEGTEPWLDKRKLVLGDNWELEIRKAVAEADAVVVCLRPEFDDIGFRQKEVRWAIEAVELRPPGRGFIIPFIVEPCELPQWCKPLHAGADLSRPTTVEELICAVEKHCAWSRDV